MARLRGVFAGFRLVFAGFWFLLRRPASWPLAAIPAVVLCALTVLAAAAALWWLQPWVATTLQQDSTSGSWAALGSSALSWLATALACALGFVVALALTPTLCSPALEKIVELCERELGAPDRPALGFWAEIWCGLRAQAMALLVAGPILIVLFAMDLLVPGAAIVTVPLKVCVLAFGLAYNLLDYPLTLRGMRQRQRLALLREHAAEALGFGLAFAVLFWLPCCSVLLLPVGVAAATELYWTRLAEPR